MAMGVTEKLAAHAFNVRYEDMRQEVIEKAKDCLLDQLGVELIGSTLDWNKIAYRYVVEMAGRAESTIVNYRRRVRCHVPTPAGGAAILGQTGISQPRHWRSFWCHGRCRPSASFETGTIASCLWYRGKPFRRDDGI